MRRYSDILSVSLIYFNKELAALKRNNKQLTIKELINISNQRKRNLMSNSEFTTEEIHQMVEENTKHTNLLKQVINFGLMDLFFEDKDEFDLQMLKRLEPSLYGKWVKQKAEEIEKRELAAKSIIKGSNRTNKAVTEDARVIQNFMGVNFEREWFDPDSMDITNRSIAYKEQLKELMFKDFLRNCSNVGFLCAKYVNNTEPAVKKYDLKINEQLMGANFLITNKEISKLSGKTVSNSDDLLYFQMFPVVKGKKRKQIMYKNGEIIEINLSLAK